MEVALIFLKYLPHSSLVLAGARDDLGKPVHLWFFAKPAGHLAYIEIVNTVFPGACTEYYPAHCVTDVRLCGN